MTQLDRLRWRAFVALSWVGWRICPEPHRSILRGSMQFDKAKWPVFEDKP